MDYATIYIAVFFLCRWRVSVMLCLPPEPRPPPHMTNVISLGRKSCFYCAIGSRVGPISQVSTYCENMRKPHVESESRPTNTDKHVNFYHHQDFVYSIMFKYIISSEDLDYEQLGGPATWDAPLSTDRLRYYNMYLATSAVGADRYFFVNLHFQC